MNSMKKQQSGFTLIELIMVIVILGILSAFALPRFADLSGDAERAATEGALGAAKSAAAIVHSSWLAGGGTATSVSLEGQTVDIVNGYPTGTLDGDRTNTVAGDICTAAQLADDFVCAQGAAGTITVTNGGCSFSYAQPASATASPTFSATITCT